MPASRARSSSSSASSSLSRINVGRFYYAPTRDSLPRLTGISQAAGGHGRSEQRPGSSSATSENGSSLVTSRIREISRPDYYPDAKGGGGRCRSELAELLFARTSHYPRGGLARVRRHFIFKRLVTHSKRGAPLVRSPARARARDSSCSHLLAREITPLRRVRWKVRARIGNFIGARALGEIANSPDFAGKKKKDNRD